MNPRQVVRIMIGGSVGGWAGSVGGRAGSVGGSARGIGCMGPRGERTGRPGAQRRPGAQARNRAGASGGQIPGGVYDSARAVQGPGVRAREEAGDPWAPKSLSTQPASPLALRRLATQPA
jgi:hypothetical protein